MEVKYVTKVETLFMENTMTKPTSTGRIKKKGHKGGWKMQNM